MKKRIKIFRMILIFLCLLLIYMVISIIFKEKKIKYIPTLGSKHIVSYQSRFSYVDIYKNNKQIIINVYSDGQVDEPNQIVIPFDGDISKDDIKIKWQASNGKEVDKESKDVVNVNVEIKQNNKVIFNKSISLAERGLKELFDYLDKRNKN